ncbi:NUDIX domain-containing protein [Thioclava sp. BHET1]|nr:NUDIX domain-containing protein [Thioclava sp. BHET1]
MPEIVNGLLLRRGEILLAHRSEARSNYPDTWSFPGGHVEDGETLEAALVRELAEEIGVQPVSWRQLDNFCCDSGEATFHFFVVDAWRGEPVNIGNEHREIRWVDLRRASEMPRLTFPIYLRIFSQLAEI